MDGLVATAKSRRNSKPIPEGMHNGICYSVLSLGSQYNKKYDNYSFKVCIIFELPDCRIDIEKDGQAHNLPRAISLIETLSLDKKANLLKILTSWRGKSFTPEELKGFDVAKILGAGAQIQVLHNVDGEKTYANIANVLPLSQGVVLDKPENPLCLYRMKLDEEGKMKDLEIPKEIPEWLQDKIKDSKEYIYTLEMNQLNTDSQEIPAQQAAENAVNTAPDDDLPF